MASHQCISGVHGTLFRRGGVSPIPVQRSDDGSFAYLTYHGTEGFTASIWRGYVPLPDGLFSI
jgi:hypothetical protein